MGRAKGSTLGIFFNRPISIILIFLTIISAFWPFFARIRKNRRLKNEKS
jgi:TctA family transporter